MCKSKRSIAVQAFWAMHVEAMTLSGLTATHYAAAHNISVVSLRRWCDLLESGEVEVDWRAYLHRSARAKISSGVSSAAKDGAAKEVLTDAAKSDPLPNRRSNRRSFTDEKKLAIVMETEQPDMSVAGVCCRHDIATSMVFRWRIQFGFCEKESAKLAAVKLADGRSGGASAPLVLHDLLQPPDGMTAVELADGRWVVCARRQRSGCCSPTCSRTGGVAMMIVPAGVKVHLALGCTDMRKGMDGLPMLVQSTLNRTRSAAICSLSSARRRKSSRFFSGTETGCVCSPRGSIRAASSGRGWSSRAARSPSLRRNSPC